MKIYSKLKDGIKEKIQTEPSAAGTRLVVISVWVATIPKPSAGARSQLVEGPDDLLVLKQL